MGIELFEHNMKAYKSALRLMRLTGKAAVIHPTGTGKSFIGFKLAEDNPDSRIVWLTPSDYIVTTQLENFKRECNCGAGPENIIFLTYARLMLMTSEEIRELQPDYCVLDEYHRAGALLWGAGFERFRSIFPDCPLLGLSATNIRYLDDRRDMAQELFDGNVASEMTLGEAVVRGILQKPKYVVALYDFDIQLKKLQKRVELVRNRAIRGEAQKKLEGLRHSLEMADGLDVILKRHITDPCGKYIVFCSNAESMENIKAMADKWFRLIDSEPHVYSVYTENACSEREFAAFKSDESGHIKLLYAINMLNEGVHVENISGVILCRMTESPIVYKQQIGRALSASRSEAPVIFDFVNNFEGLSTISSVDKEMEQAVSYYRSSGKESYIVNESFEIIDEVRDSVKLFKDLESSLGASWDSYYAAAEKYYREHGDLKVKKRYITEEGLALGNWIVAQRQNRHANDMSLTASRISKLDAIGMDWELRSERSWREGYAHAAEYAKTHGVLDTPQSYKCEDGFPLGAWLAGMRNIRKNGHESSVLTKERIAMLDSLNMVWKKTDTRWEENYAAARSYYETYGDLNVPSKYVTENGIRLGSWLQRLRAVRAGRDAGAELTDEEIERLNSIGMKWTNRNEEAWNRNYEAVRRYCEEHGSINMPSRYTDKSGLKLRRWIDHQRDMYKLGRLTESKIKKLEAVGMEWNVLRESAENKLEILRKYHSEHGNINIDPSEVIDGVWIGKWLGEQRKKYKNGTLGQDLTDQLDALGMDWLDRSERRWERAFAEAEEYYNVHGNLNVPRTYKSKSGFGLRRWLDDQRRSRNGSKANTALNSVRIDRLSQIGMEW